LKAEAKISPAFEPYLAESKRNEIHEAVVIYRSPDLPEDENLRDGQRRRRRVHDQIALHKAVETRIHEEYQEASRGALEITPIGGSALPAVTAEVTPAMLMALARQPDVVAILPNQKIHLIKPELVAYDEPPRQTVKEGTTWGLQMLEIPKVWERTRGAGITVAVLDTGVHADHPALDGRVAGFALIDPLGRRIQAAPPFDAAMHGTHVCGTIAGGKTPEGIAVGVAPASRLLVAGVLLGEPTLHTLLEGLAWAVEQGADIINLSLGFNYYEPHFTRVFDVLIEQFGVLPVVSIGNENQGNSSSPGNAYNALAVGAVERLPRNRLDVAFFSSGASLVFPGDENTLVVKPDIVAPGVQVYSTIPPTRRGDGEYWFTFADGTSMASPHVAATAALLMSAYPTAPVSAIVQALKETARHPGGSQRRPDNRWGHGLIQPVEALRAMQ
jgi:subtilisin family serine protease